MAETFKAMLGETEYDIPYLLFGEIEELTMTALNKTQRSQDALRMALRRCEPPIADIEKLPATIAQINYANAKLLGRGVEAVSEKKD